jgi:hypothetical protein
MPSLLFPLFFSRPVKRVRIASAISEFHIPVPCNRGSCRHGGMGITVGTDVSDPGDNPVTAGTTGFDDVASSADHKRGW